MLNLSQDTAIRMQYNAKGFYEDRFLPWVKSAFDAVDMLGDNPVAEGCKDKCLSMQKLYNEQIAPQQDALLAEYGKISDLSEKLASVKMNTSITSQVAGEIKTGQFDAAMDL